MSNTNCTFCMIPITDSLYCSSCAVNINNMSDNEVVALARARKVPEERITAYITTKENKQ